MKDVLFHLCKINGLSASWTASASATIASWTRTVTGGSSTIRIRSRGIVTPTWIIVTVASGSRIGIISRWIGAGRVAVVGGSTVGRSVATIHLIWTITIALIRRPSSYIITVGIRCISVSILVTAGSWTSAVWIALLSTTQTTVVGVIGSSSASGVCRIGIATVISIAVIPSIAIAVSGTKKGMAIIAKSKVEKWVVKTQPPIGSVEPSVKEGAIPPKGIIKGIVETPVEIKIPPWIVVYVINFGSRGSVTPRGLRIDPNIIIAILAAVIIRIRKDLTLWVV